jgi:hypothetical protein
MQVKTHVRFRNLNSVSENITSELAEKHTLTVKQHGCFNVRSTAAEKLDRKRKVLWPSPQCCPYFPKKTRYPKLSAYPKYGNFTLQDRRLRLGTFLPNKSE